MLLVAGFASLFLGACSIALATPAPTNQETPVTSAIDRVKFDGADLHEPSGQVMWDLAVKTGETESRKLRYFIESPKDLMVLAD